MYEGIDIHDEIKINIVLQERELKGTTQRY